MQRDIARDIRGVFGGDTEFQKAGFVVERLICRVLQIHSLMGKMPNVFIFGIVGFAADLQRNLMRFGICDFFLARFDAPFPPGCNHLHIRRKRLDSHFKPHLIIALAGAAVADCIRPLFQRNLYNVLCNHRARKCRSEQIIFIFCACLHAGEHIIREKFLCQVLNIELGCTGFKRLFLQPLKLPLLPDIGANGNDFRVAVVLLQPRNNDGGIKPSRICHNNFLNGIFFHFSHLGAKIYAYNISYNA